MLVFMVYIETMYRMVVRPFDIKWVPSQLFFNRCPPSVEPTTQFIKIDEMALAENTQLQEADLADWGVC